MSSTLESTKSHFAFIKDYKHKYIEKYIEFYVRALIHPHKENKMYKQSPNNVKSIYEEIEINERLIFGFIYSIVLIVSFLIAFLCHLKITRDEFRHKSTPHEVEIRQYHSSEDGSNCRNPFFQACSTTYCIQPPLFESQLSSEKKGRPNWEWWKMVPSG